MKKLLIVIIFIFMVSGIFADDFMKPANNKIPLELPEFSGRPYVGSREIPDYEFITEPTEIIMNYYDYMPGSYCGIPVQVQPEISQPNGFEAGGVYIVFHARETAEATRRVYCAYIDSWGNITNCETIGSEDIHEGYAGIDIDPITGDPFVAWHGNYDTQTVDLEVVCSYDLYHIFGAPGNWKEPFTVINDTINSPNPPDDEFIWPYLHIGPSPDPDKRRVYIIANNAFSPSGTPSENVLIAYADFDDVDLANQSTFDWTYNTIPLLDEWNQGIPEWIRPHLSMCVSNDGKVALMGYSTKDSIFVFLNENYGDGDYTYYSEDFRHFVDNPQNAFININGNPYILYFSFLHCGHLNTIFSNDNSEIRFIGTMGLFGEDPDYPNTIIYWPYYIYPKEYKFDMFNNEFSFFDLYPQGEYPNDDEPFLPWSTEPWTLGWPIWYHDNQNAFYESTFKIVKNEEKNWLAAVWHDGLKNKYAHEGVPGYEEWLEVPEIAICISADNGQTWSEPIFMNSIETPELSEMIPVYIYPGDLIEDLGDDHGKLHLFFLDDYSYGSGNYLGGMMMYASLDIDFGPFASTEDETILQVSYELYNYPNPFKPSGAGRSPATTISFSLSENTKDVKIEIYNIKGQKIKTLVNEKLPPGEHSVIWDGRDSNSNRVSSGIYFYKLKAGRYQRVRKMLLLK